jgi:hypothetical protein
VALDSKRVGAFELQIAYSVSGRGVRRLEAEVCLSLFPFSYLFVGLIGSLYT